MTRPAHAIGRVLAKSAGVADPSIHWRLVERRALLRQQVATLLIEGRDIAMLLDKAVPGEEETKPKLERVLEHQLVSDPRESLQPTADVDSLAAVGAQPDR